MEITKKSLIALIERMVLDKTVEKHIISDYYSSSKNGINIINNTCYKNKLDYYHKDECINQRLGDFSFKKIDFKREEMIYNSVHVKFNNEPPITIKPLVTYLPCEPQIIEGRKFFLFKANIIAKKAVVNLEYILKCGKYEFPISEKEVEYIYTIVLSQKNKQKELLEYQEIMMRFDKYGVQLEKENENV